MRGRLPALCTLCRAAPRGQKGVTEPSFPGRTRKERPPVESKRGTGALPLLDTPLISHLSCDDPRQSSNNASPTLLWQMPGRYSRHLRNSRSAELGCHLGICCWMWWLSGTAKRAQRPSMLHSDKILEAGTGRGWKLLRFWVAQMKCCSWDYTNPQQKKRHTCLSTVLYTEASKMTRLFNNRKLSVIMRSTFHISASVTFETNIWTNQWKGSGSLSSGLSGGVSPSHHPTFENLGDQQAEDARTKWQTLAANLKQDVWKRSMPEGLQYLASYCWYFRGYLILGSITQTLRRFETNNNL